MSGKLNPMYASKRVGVLNPFFNKKHSKQTKQHLSKVKTGSLIGSNNPMFGIHRYGSKAPRWEGGKSRLNGLIRNLKEYSIWRLKIFKRDNYTCKICGKLSRGDIEAHHIKPLSYLLSIYNIKTTAQAVKCKPLWYIRNGITLCKKCHKKTDTYGWKIYNKIKERK
jgi:5-methylcytosine-specific restriction endonuclease McrA